jgi:hypothetical protein
VRAAVWYLGSQANPKRVHAEGGRASHLRRNAQFMAVLDRFRGCSLGSLTRGWLQGNGFTLPVALATSHESGFGPSRPTSGACNVGLQRPLAPWPLACQHGPPQPCGPCYSAATSRAMLGEINAFPGRGTGLRKVRGGSAAAVPRHGCAPSGRLSRGCVIWCSN